VTVYPADPVIPTTDHPEATYVVPAAGTQLLEVVRHAVRATPWMTITDLTFHGAHIARRPPLWAATAAVILEFSQDSPGMTTIRGRVRPQMNTYREEVALRDVLVSIKRQLDSPH
jgi:hypothetical protein